MRIFRFHSYKKVQSFSEKEKLYMDDARFVWNFLSYRDNARTRESRQQSSARTALGPSRPQRLTVVAGGHIFRRRCFSGGIHGA